MAQPDTLLAVLFPSISVCSGWDQPLQFALILGEEGEEEGHCHLQVFHCAFLGASKGFGCQRPRAPKSLGYF